MLLENKVAVIYGGGGSLGGEVAPIFAPEGSTIFLTRHIDISLNVIPSLRPGAHNHLHRSQYFLRRYC